MAVASFAFHGNALHFINVLVCVLYRRQQLTIHALGIFLATFVLFIASDTTACLTYISV
ncbi:hypothetical protein EDC04DRAFT_2695472, partial [Pisolithus marmoratus]